MENDEARHGAYALIKTKTHTKAKDYTKKPIEFVALKTY